MVFVRPVMVIRPETMAAAAALVTVKPRKYVVLPPVPASVQVPDAAPVMVALCSMMVTAPDPASTIGKGFVTETATPPTVGTTEKLSTPVATMAAPRAVACRSTAWLLVTVGCVVLKTAPILTGLLLFAVPEAETPCAVTTPVTVVVEPVSVITCPSTSVPAESLTERLPDASTAAFCHNSDASAICEAWFVVSPTKAALHCNCPFDAGAIGPAIAISFKGRVLIIGPGAPEKV